MRRKATQAEIDESKEHILEAAQHLARCWDSLRAAELVTMREIETEDITELCFNLDAPDYCYSEPIKDDWIRQILEANPVLEAV